MPEELHALLDSRPETRGCEVTLAVPELCIRFDGCGGNDRNADVVFSAGRVAGTIEAKADEAFGNGTVGDELQAVRNPRSRLPERIDLLSRAVFGREPDDAIKSLRYQLLFSFAATLVEARRRNAEVAVFVVHEFVSSALSPRRLADNATALAAFVSSFPGWAAETITVGTLLPPITLPGGQFVPGDLPVMLGKIRHSVAELQPY